MSDGTTTWTNTYNSDGLRTSRTNGTITYNYYYDGSQLTSVSGSNGNIWIFYDGNRPVIIKYGDTETYHYELNLQGDVIAILDSSGNRVVEYTYDAWGKILSITGSMKDTLGQANPLRYRGYVYDHETGLYYCQSRYYDPELGRWLNADTFTSTGQGFIGNNMFAYCNNNPVNCSDPSGDAWIHISPIRADECGAVPHFVGSSDGEEKSDVLLNYVLSMYSAEQQPFNGNLVYASVKYGGVFKKDSRVWDWVSIISGNVIKILFPTAGEGVGLLLEIAGVIDLGYSYIERLPDGEYFQYTVTMTWTDTVSPIGYPVITQNHQLVITYVWNDSKKDSPFWQMIGYDHGATSTTRWR